MTERREALTAGESAMLKRRAIGVVPVALAIGVATVWMLGWGATEISVGVRVFFGLFLGGILFFIVGVHVGSAFEREKRASDVDGVVAPEQPTAQTSNTICQPFTPHPAAAVQVEFDQHRRQPNQGSFVSLSPFEHLAGKRTSCGRPGQSRMGVRGRFNSWSANVLVR